MHVRYIHLFIGLLITTIFSGCAQHIRPVTRAHLGTERVLYKNYELGQKLAAYVGQPIVKVKDYKVERYKAKHMRVSDDFIISGGYETITGDKNKDYEVIGETTINDKTFTVVNIPDSQFGVHFGVLIKADGTVYNKVLKNNNIMEYSFSASPPGLRFISLKDEEINVDAGYLNYELIYGGTDEKSIIITYREYTSNDLARPAFYKDLVYEPGQSQIRYRDTVIKIYEANNEKIVYTVMGDGLSE